MRTIKLAWSLIAGSLSFVLSFAGSASVGVEYDKRADFGQYKTYAWAIGVPAPDSRTQARLHSAIERELASQGLRKTAGTPDIYVSTHMAIWRQRVINVNELGYSGFYWRRSGGLYPPTTQVYYPPIGTVTVDLLDAESRERVWRGFAIEYLTHKPQRTDKLVDKVSRKMFKRFPGK